MFTSLKKSLLWKAQSRLGKLPPAERGTKVTVCGGINAAGNHNPLYFIFPRVDCQPRMLNGAPPGSDGTASVSGWMIGPLFLKFMHHFVRFCNPRDDEKVLLILDNHESHVSLDAVNFARENNIVMLTIPPRTNYFFTFVCLVLRVNALSSVYFMLKKRWRTFNGLPGKVSVKGGSSLLDVRRDLIPAEITKNRLAWKYICVNFL